MTKNKNRIIHGLKALSYTFLILSILYIAIFIFLRLAANNCDHVYEIKRQEALIDSSYIFLYVFVSTFVLGVSFLSAYFALKKKTKLKTGEKNKKTKEEFGDAEFNTWIAEFEPLTKMALKLGKTDLKSFSKFGGLPIVPESFEWPEFHGRPLSFLLQIDFGELNNKEQLKDFPSSGLLYVFVNVDNINFSNEYLNVQDYSYKEGEAFKILFFEDGKTLKEAQKPSDLEFLLKEFNVASNDIKTYPDPDDCEDAFKIYCNRPKGGMDDEYDHLQWQNADVHMIGGWATYVQSGGYMNKLKNSDDDRWTLLLQIGSEGNDDNFMWGDCGTLYFYIREKDLKAHNFNAVKLDMQCT